MTFLSKSPNVCSTTSIISRPQQKSSPQAQVAVIKSAILRIFAQNTWRNCSPKRSFYLLNSYFLLSSPDTSSVSFHSCCWYPASLQSIRGLRQCEMKQPPNLRPGRPPGDARHPVEFVRGHPRIATPRRAHQVANVPRVSFGALFFFLHPSTLPLLQSLPNTSNVAA